MSDAARSLSYRVTVRSESRFVSQPPVRIKSLALSQFDLYRRRCERMEADMNAPVMSDVTSAGLLSRRLTTDLAPPQRLWWELIASLLERYRPELA